MSTPSQIGTTVTASSASSPVTSPGINTTGATLLIVTVSASSNITAATVTDSNGNSWHARQNEVDAGTNTNTGMWYSYDSSGSALVTGAGHTVTVSGLSFVSITVSAFNGTLPNHVDPYDSSAGESGGDTSSGTTVQPGSITAISGSLVVTCLGMNGGAFNSISFPYVCTGNIAFSAGAHYGNAVGFSTNATTTNPTWTATTTTALVATIASFKAAPAQSIVIVTSPAPLSTLTINPLHSGAVAYQSGPGINEQAALLTQGISNPVQLSMIMNEALQNLQSQIQSLQYILSLPPQLQSLVLNSADIAVLNVGQQYGPGQLNVYSGPPTYPQVGWAGTDPMGDFPVLNISGISGGVVTTTTNHNLKANQVVFIAGTSNSSDNGTFVVATTPLTTTFTAVGISGSSSGGTVQRQGVGGWFKTLAVGGASYYDVVTNNTGMYADETGVLHIPGAFVTGTLAAGTVATSSRVISDVLVDNLTLTNNSPGAGSIAWSNCDLYYKGTHYAITGSNTSSQFVTWTVGNTTFTGINSPTFVPGPTVFLIATNSAGTADTAWNKLALGGVDHTNMFLPQALEGPNGSLIVDITWTNNTPTNEVTWSTGQVTYQGITYSIPTGHTSSTFWIYWQLSSPTSFQSSATSPSLGIDDFVVGFNLGSGVFTPVKEVHTTAGDRVIMEGGGVSLYNTSNLFAGSIDRAGSAAAALRLADGTGSGSLGTGQKIIATGSDGKVQMATFEVNAANSSGGNTWPNFKNMDGPHTPSGTGTNLTTGMVFTWLKVNVNGGLVWIPCFS